MTNTEFANEFDTLVASHLYDAAFGDEAFIQEPVFDDYQKSVFLTLALDLLVVAYYNGTGGAPFEATEEVRRFMESLVITHNCDVATSSDKVFSVGGKLFELPKDIWFIVYEQASYSGGTQCFNGKAIDVVPVTHDTFNRTKGNPFRGPSDKRILRLDCGGNNVELVSKYPVTSYTIRYIKEPSPIILTLLEGDVKIKGSLNAQSCTLHPALHRKILEIAVLLALASRFRGTLKS